METTAAIVIIGNEILSGKVCDTNSTYLCRELRQLGVNVQRIITIPDDAEIIGHTVRQMSDAYTWVFTSGGIGPTHDDITISAIAMGFGLAAHLDDELVSLLKDHYQERLTPEHLRMALVPPGSILLRHFDLPFPQVQFRNILIFPGIPELLVQRFQVLKEQFRQPAILLKEIFLNMDEGQIAHTLDETMAHFPLLLLGSYPTFPSAEKWYRVKLTLESYDSAYLETAYLFSESISC